MNAFSPERLTPLQYTILKYHQNTPYNFAGSVLDPRHWYTTFSMRRITAKFARGIKRLKDLQQLIQREILTPNQIKTPVDNIMIVNSTRELVSYLSNYVQSNRRKFIIEQPCSSHLNMLHRLIPSNTASANYSANGFHNGELAQLIDRCDALLFLMPDNHNPTGLTLSQNRRLILSEMLRCTGTTVFENLSLRPLHFKREQAPTFSSLLPEQTITFGSLDNLYNTGSPLFWYTIPPALQSRFPDTPVRTPEAQELQYACDFISAFYQNRHKLLEENKIRLEAMEDALTRFMPESKWITPAGGQYLWVDIHEPIDTGELLSEVLKYGVSFVPGNIFYSNKQSVYRKMRLSFTYSTPQEIHKGIKIIRSSAEKMLLQKSISNK